MTHRWLVSAGIFVFVALTATGQSPKSKNWTAPRTADGHPDLQGIWTNATLTKLERPKDFEGKVTVSDADAKAFEKGDADELKKEDGASDGLIIAAAGSSGTGGYNTLFVDHGTELARVDGVKRTSLIIDPPDGRIPALTPAAREQNARTRRVNSYDSVQDRPLSERCLIGFGSTAGPPMLPVLYNNTYQIVQTGDYVMIMIEMIHDARIVRINGTHAAANVRQWFGDSIGHWEGDTLVVDTTNFTDKTRFRGSSENLHVIERFTRVGPGTILYKATVDDPTTFTKNWTLEYPFVATAGPVYEYACHEGNYAMTDILGGAREMEKAKENK
jgi:hypothetical protein